MRQEIHLRERRTMAISGLVLAVMCGCSGTSTSAGANGGGTSNPGSLTGGANQTSASALGGSPSGGASAVGGAINTGGLPNGGVSAGGASVGVGGAPLTGGNGATGGSNATGGTSSASGGTATGGSKAASGGAATGGSKTAGGGATAGGAKTTGSGGALTGGATSTASGQGGSTTSAGGGCTLGGTWPTADPSKTGPFAVTTENNVGPQAGVGEDGGTPPQFTLFRPTDLAQGGLCHPLITWGNGHGTTPSIYSNLLKRMASHGFVVIASNSSQVSQGTPAPMLAGVTWVLEQNADPTSELYQRIDTTHIGATGHSEGAMATASAGADSRILTIAPICNGSNARNLHGPALLMCGGQDTTLPCSGSVTALNSITTLPALVGDYLTATHTSWMTFGNTAPSPMEVADLAWMRLQLMGDTTLRSMFYGASCTLCTDSAWQITQNSLMNQ